MSDERPPFNELQTQQLADALHRGVAESANALGKWLAAEATVTIESVDQCPLEEAVQVLGSGDEIACMCQMQMQGTLTGQLLLAFDDASGLPLSDLLLSRPIGAAQDWGEVETSAAVETMNIVGSAYLNGIASSLSDLGNERISLIPSPPRFLRDFVESLLESAFVEQAENGRYIVFAETRFELHGRPLSWAFLLIPDADSLRRLTQMLAASKPEPSPHR